MFQDSYKTKIYTPNQTLKHKEHHQILMKNNLNIPFTKYMPYESEEIKIDRLPAVHQKRLLQGAAKDFYSVRMTTWKYLQHGRWNS